LVPSYPPKAKEDVLSVPAAAKVAGVDKTKDEAQAIVDAEVQAAQATWDAQTDEEKADPMNTRPADITLEE